MLLMTFDETMSNDFLLEYVKGNPSYSLAGEVVCSSNIDFPKVRGEDVLGWLRHRRDQRSQ